MEAFGYNYKHVLPHGSYLINLGNPDAYVPLYIISQLILKFIDARSEKRKTSYDCFLDDLVRCEQTGISLYNFQYASYLFLTSH